MSFAANHGLGNNPYYALSQMYSRGQIDPGMYQQLLGGQMNLADWRNATTEGIQKNRPGAQLPPMSPMGGGGMGGMPGMPQMPSMPQMPGFPPMPGGGGAAPGGPLPRGDRRPGGQSSVPGGTRSPSLDTDYGSGGRYFEGKPMGSPMVGWNGGQTRGNMYQGWDGQWYDALGQQQRSGGQQGGGFWQGLPQPGSAPGPQPGSSGGQSGQFPGGGRQRNPYEGMPIEGGMPSGGGMGAQQPMPGGMPGQFPVGAGGPMPMGAPMPGGMPGQMPAGGMGGMPMPMGVPQPGGMPGQIGAGGGGSMPMGAVGFGAENWHRAGGGLGGNGAMIPMGAVGGPGGSGFSLGQNGGRSDEPAAMGNWLNQGGYQGISYAGGSGTGPSMGLVPGQHGGGAGGLVYDPSRMPQRPGMPTINTPPGSLPDSQVPPQMPRERNSFGMPLPYGQTAYPDGSRTYQEWYMRNQYPWEQAQRGRQQAPGSPPQPAGPKVDPWAQPQPQGQPPSPGGMPGQVGTGMGDAERIMTMPIGGVTSGNGNGSAGLYMDLLRGLMGQGGQPTPQGVPNPGGLPGQVGVGSGSGGVVPPSGTGQITTPTQAGPVYSPSQQGAAVGALMGQSGRWPGIAGVPAGDMQGRFNDLLSSMGSQAARALDTQISGANAQQLLDSRQRQIAQGLGGADYLANLYRSNLGLNTGYNNALMSYLMPFIGM